MDTWDENISQNDRVIHDGLTWISSSPPDSSLPPLIATIRTQDASGKAAITATNTKRPHAIRRPIGLSDRSTSHRASTFQEEKEEEYRTAGEEAVLRDENADLWRILVRQLHVQDWWM